MPESANRLGSKGRFVYITDDQTKYYAIDRDLTLAVAGFGSGAAAPQTVDGFTPPNGVTITPPPKNFKPRTVYIVDRATGSRKAMTCFSRNSELYDTSASKTVDIDGIEFVTTGRRGESLSF